MPYIYNSRNYRSLLASENQRRESYIYNSRNYRSLLAAHIGIDRNLLSTIVEIIEAY